MNNNELLKQAMNVVAERHDFKDFIYLVPHANNYAKTMELIAEVASEYAEAYHAAKLEQGDNDIDDDIYVSIPAKSTTAYKCIPKSKLEVGEPCFNERSVKKCLSLWSSGITDFNHFVDWLNTRAKPDFPQYQSLDDKDGREPEPLTECNGFCGTNDLLVKKTA